MVASAVGGFPVYFYKDFVSSTTYKVASGPAGVGNIVVAAIDVPTVPFSGGNYVFYIFPRWRLPIVGGAPTVEVGGIGVGVTTMRGLVPQWFVRTVGVSPVVPAPTRIVIASRSTAICG